MRSYEALDQSPNLLEGSQGFTFTVTLKWKKLDQTTEDSCLSNNE